MGAAGEQPHPQVVAFQSRRQVRCRDPRRRHPLDVPQPPDDAGELGEPVQPPGHVPVMPVEDQRLVQERAQREILERLAERPPKQHGQAAVDDARRVPAGQLRAPGRAREP
jgi:hypothetical protein